VKPKAVVACDYVSVAPPGTTSEGGWKTTLFGLSIFAALWVGLAVLFAYLWKNNEKFHHFIATTLGLGANNPGQGGSLHDSDDEEVLTPGSEGVVDSDDMGLSSDEEDN